MGKKYSEFTSNFASEFTKGKFLYFWFIKMQDIFENKLGKASYPSGPRKWLGYDCIVVIHFGICNSPYTTIAVHRCYFCHTVILWWLSQQAWQKDSNYCIQIFFIKTIICKKNASPLIFQKSEIVYLHAYLSSKVTSHALLRNKHCSWWNFTSNSLTIKNNQYGTCRFAIIACICEFSCSFIMHTVTLSINKT